MAARRSEWLRRCLIGAAFTILASTSTPASEYEGEAPADCCEITAEWRIPKGAAPQGSERYRLLQRNLGSVARQFRRHGICLIWHEGLALPFREIYADTDRTPRIEEWTSIAPLGEILLVFAEKVLTIQHGTVVERLGATPGAGANVAAVALAHEWSDQVRIHDELLHIFGLSDRDLGVTDDDPIHKVAPEHWRFARRVCEVSHIRDGKTLALTAKNRCVLAGDRASACFTAP